MIGPAKTITTRFQSACDSKVRLRSSGRTGFGLALLEHLHEAAEREEADAVLGLLAADAQDLGPEAERERDDLDPEDLRPREVPELVHEDERRDRG